MVAAASSTPLANVLILGILLRAGRAVESRTNCLFALGSTVTSESNGQLFANTVALAAHVAASVSLRA